MLVVQSLVKTGLILALVILGFGTLGAVIGFSLGVLVAGVTGVLLIYVMYRALPKPPEGKLEFIKTTKIMLKYGLPLSIGGILGGFLTQFYSTILYIFVTDNSLIGNYSVSLNFVVLITFFATPVTTMLFPAFSKVDAKKERELCICISIFSKYATLVSCSSNSDGYGRADLRLVQYLKASMNSTFIPSSPAITSLNCSWQSKHKQSNKQPRIHKIQLKTNIGKI